MTFSYTAVVRQTSANDSTTLVSPDPVLPKLTNIVDVHYAYPGSPDGVTVSAELSTPAAGTQPSRWCAQNLPHEPTTQQGGWTSWL